MQELVVLTLKRASKSRPGGPCDDDDYDVRFRSANGKVVGRILRAVQPPQDRPWFWTITARAPQLPTQRGYAATRDEAMDDFKLAWERAP